MLSWLPLIHSDRIHIILNPYAGRWKGAKLYKKIARYAKFFKHFVNLQLTTAPGDAIKIARESDANILIAAGGDGTVNEVVNGILTQKELKYEKILGVIPIGSGNDFAKMLNLRAMNIKLAIEVARRGKTINSDAGIIEYKTHDGIEMKRYFINGVGIGFDATVAAESQKIRYLRGLPLYLLSLFKTLSRYRAPQVELSINGKTFCERIYLIAIGNGTSAGGGFLLTPYASITDGVFDVCVVKNVSIPRVIQVFPSVLKGRHLRYPEVSMFKAEEISVSSEDELTVHADGEILGRKIKNLKVSVLPSSVKVISNI